MSEELKPCGTCGSNDVRVGEHLLTSVFTVRCICGIESCGYVNAGYAITEWNTRHITLSQAKQILAEAGMVAIPKDAQEGIDHPYDRKTPFAALWAELDSMEHTDIKRAYDEMVLKAVAQQKPGT
jgi:hypothetical protein